MIELKKFRRYEILEGFEVKPDMLTEKGQKTIRELIRGIVYIELFSGKVIANTREDRLILSAGCWVLKDKTGRHQVATSEEFKRNYESVRQ
ncbi:MAG: hypothetical protein A2Y71_03115 [Bacteroidetes bacterium RBG_13_42_15]|nr:MAG: hypothetical protein A2Y71_03115 [Bacteroidetes bacterium RBG_13_42_15]